MGGGVWEFELVISVDGPGVVSEGAEVRGEWAGLSVEGEDLFWGDFFHGFEESSEVGVVRKGEGGIDLVSVLGAWGERPSGEHGGAAIFLGSDGSRADGIGWGDDGVAWGDCFF